MYELGLPLGAKVVFRAYFEYKFDMLGRVCKINQFAHPTLQFQFSPARFKFFTHYCAIHHIAVDVHFVYSHKNRRFHLQLL